MLPGGTFLYHLFVIIFVQGITMFAIGVGTQYQLEELENIASQPYDTYVSTVDNYDALDGLKKELAWKTCKGEENSGNLHKIF